MVDDGGVSGTMRPLRLFLRMNLPISRCQLVSVTRGATTSAGRARFSVARYASVWTVLPRPISSASSALPDDLIRKSRPFSWNFRRSPLNWGPGFARPSLSNASSAPRRDFAALAARLFHTAAETTSSGYRSIIHFRCLMLPASSGTIASSGPSPHHDCGTSWEIMRTARGPVTFQLHDCEYLSITYSSVPKSLIMPSVV